MKNTVKFDGIFLIQLLDNMRFGVSIKVRIKKGVRV